jgi:hypothetical protein
MIIEINRQEAILLVELLQKVDGRDQYADVQNEIDSLLNCFVGFVPANLFERGAA